MVWSVASGVVVLVSGLLCVATAIGCSQGSSTLAPTSDANLDAPACERVLPDCPKTPPSYATTIEPIVTERCVGCHYAHSTLARTDLTSYAKVFGDRGAVLTQVFSCQMPQDGSLGRAERQAMLEWLVCGAPNN